MSPRAQISAVAVAAATIIASTTGAPAVTLEDAIVTTLQTNPEVTAIRDNRRAIDQELRAARGLYYPSIDIAGEYGYEVSNNVATGGTDVDKFPNEVGAIFNQLIFDGFGREGEVDRQIGRVRSAAYRVFDTVEVLALRAVEVFLDVQRTTEIVGIAQENVDEHESLLDLVTRRAQSGAGPRSDIDQAVARVGAAKASLAVSRGRQEDSVANYIAVVGAMPENLLRPNPPEDALPPTIDVAVETALANSPVVQVAAAEIERASGEVTVAESNFWPRLDLRAEANREEDQGGISGVATDYSVNAVMTYNIFRGGIDAARVQESKERLAQSRSELDVSRRDVAEETRLAWNGLFASRETGVALREEVEANVKVRDAYFQQFEVNRRSLLDLLDVQNELFVSRTQLVTEDFTTEFGVYRVLATMGLLTPTLGISSPSESTPPPQ
ncbi:MAG: TolC family outer membrane protein [Alphaproteobacteria bacterium]|nr:TolC family outer membrane protein [Alphaproteobacteria bacterium]